MAVYILTGKYTLPALGKISAKRSQDAAKLIKKHKGKLVSGWGLLGQADLLLVVEFPGNEEALQASAALAKTLGIAFATSPAVPLDRFDALLGQA